MKITLKDKTKKKKLKQIIKSPKFKKQLKQDLIKTIATIIFTFIYGFGMSWFLLASKIRLYSGGIPGIGQLLVDFIKLFNLKIINYEKYIISSVIIIGNIPLFLLAG